MEKTEEYIEKLKEAVEQRMGGQLFNHSDFMTLSALLYDYNETVISHTTLKRMWGYLKNETPKPQIRTLNILSVFAGFKNWKDFCKYQDNLNDYSSEFILHESVHSYMMEPGQKIEIEWYPNRKVTLRREGETNVFTVTAQENSKLTIGMTLQCESFIKGEPLLLKNIKGGNITNPCDYLCGKINGIDYTLKTR